VSNSWWHLREARRVLRGGGVVAHATEGVWGFACDPDDPAAVARVLTLKGRSADLGLILIGQHANVFADELDRLSEPDRQTALDAWPGAATFVMPNLAPVPWPRWITGEHDGVAVRVPGHEQARLLCAVFGGALVSTSANPSGRVAPVTELKVRAYFGRRVDFYLPGAVISPGTPSSIYDFSRAVTVRSGVPVA